MKADVNLVSLVERFGSEEKCRTYLEALRWPSGPVCPKCGSVSASRIKARGQLDCNACRYQFSVTAGTIFHDSHLPLWKWFLTAYMMIEAKKGVSANQIKRTISVSYKTSWYLCHRIRAAMTETNPELLGGTVEADETYVGGKQRKIWKPVKENKTMVMGVVERGGKTRLKSGGKDEKDLYRELAHSFLRRHLRPDTARLMTDEHAAYKGFADEDTRHETVRHTQKEWGVGDVHTNTVESVWSLLKRSIVGSYHKISTKHLDAYLHELEWRFNNRRNPYLFRDTLRMLLRSDTLPYRQLTSVSGRQAT
jgi:transposase-like protein